MEIIIVTTINHIEEGHRLMVDMAMKTVTGPNIVK